MLDESLKPSDVLSNRQISELKKKKEWKNILSISSNWFQIVSALALFYYFPHWSVFLFSLIVVGSRQFALAVLAHEGAHNLLFSSRKINDWCSQWFCAYPIFQDNRVYRPYHLKHHRFTETDEDPVIKPNPVSGIIEHINYQWLEGSVLYKDCFIWLKPFVRWIRNKRL